MHHIQPSQLSRAEITVLPMQLAEFPAVAAAAAADGHILIHPTHVVKRGNEIVGYGSLGAVRMMFAWLDSKKLSGPESFRAWRQAETELKRMGGPIALPCTADSPLLPFVERMGYRGIFNARVHVKDFQTQ